MNHSGADWRSSATAGVMWERISGPEVTITAGESFDDPCSEINAAKREKADRKRRETLALPMVLCLERPYTISSGFLNSFEELFVRKEVSGLG
jgi:hypothetical protein